MRRLRVSLVGILISAAIGACAATIGVGLGGANPAAAASVVDLPVPAGSHSFGKQVLVLSNGNYVVTDPTFEQTEEAVGAVWLYDGATNQVISTLTGSTSKDTVGSSGVYEVGDGNFIVRSSKWDSGGVVDAGAVTWVNGVTGLNGVVSTANSLVGSTLNDSVGNGPEPVVLENGNYFIISADWGTGDLGAMTWGDGSQGVVGAVSAANSIVGEHDEDFADFVVYPLENSHAVLATPRWDDGVTVDVGAATWIDGLAGRSGVITHATSLYGTTPGDMVGDGVTELSNGNYVLSTPTWDNDLLTNAGAATWGNGATGTVGPVSLANSLIGQQTGDAVGSGGIKALTNGNYVVQTEFWHNLAVAGAGAATWATGTAPTSGFVTAANSIHGSVANDFVSSVVTLTNGNYVVYSAQVVIDGNINAGGAMWASGTGPTSAAMSSANSIHGSTVDDHVGQQIIPLTNGNFVVKSLWQTGGIQVGATTWASGTGPTVLAIDPTNSLVGSTTGDALNVRVTALTNGNYLVAAGHWTKAGVIAVGAVTWGSGVTGIVGPISVANSFVGATADDGSLIDVKPLDNGNALVLWPLWNAGVVVDAGAATLISGTAPTVGSVSAANSFVGSSANDNVGSSAHVLEDGNALVRSPSWNNLATADAGAATWINANGPTAGQVSSANSLVGTVANSLIGDSVGPAFAGGGYIVRSTHITHDMNADAGAVTYSEPGGVTGTMSPSNTVFGFAAMRGAFIGTGERYTAADAVVVGRPFDNAVSLIITADKTPPSFAPVLDVTVQASPGAHSAVVDYPLPTATDARSTPTVSCAPPSGSSFPVGTTTVTCVATDGVGLTATTTFKINVIGNDDYVPLAPARVADTRVGFTTVDGAEAGGGLLDVGSILELQVAGRGGVAADATAATLNVTAVDAVAPGFATVWPCGEPRPTASNLNFTTGATVPNAVLAKIGAGGKVCLFTSQPIHLVVDVNGYFPVTTSYRPLNPGRLLDTRAEGVTVDGTQQRTGAVAADSTTTLQVSGRGGVPADATSVVLNVTTTESVADGYITAYPCDSTRPNASSVNGVATKTVANLVISKIDDDGTLCLYAQSAGHLIADVNGYFTAAGSYVPLVAARVQDTRPGFTTVDGQSAGGGLLPLGTVTRLHINGRGGVPDASTVVLNVTVTEPGAPGYVTVYPCGPTLGSSDPPNASNLNYATGQTVANGALVKIGDGGDVCLYNSQPTHLVVDVTGYFPS